MLIGVNETPHIKFTSYLLPLEWWRITIDCFNFLYLLIHSKTTKII